MRRITLLLLICFLLLGCAKPRLKARRFMRPDGEVVTFQELQAEAPEPTGEQRCPSCGQVTKHGEPWNMKLRERAVGDEVFLEFLGWEQTP